MPIQKGSWKGMGKMKRAITRVGILLAVHILLASASASSLQAPEQPAPGRNVVIFIADGLRSSSVTPELAPTMFRLREKGVFFANSHSLYPTFTTPNASAFATGHLLGDTGDFGNALYTGYPIPKDDRQTLTPFIEDDVILAKLNALYDGNYLGEATLAETARAHGYNVIIIGKLGPVAIQDISEIKLLNNALQPTQATVIDDSTGPKGIPLSDNLTKEMSHADLKSSAPDRTNGQDASSKGNNGRSAGTLAANYVQQQYFANMATQAALPASRKDAKPFLLIYWSRDPDGTQHNQGDSVGFLEPGINGPTSHAAVRNADNNLAQILEFLRFNEIADNTDVIVVADHGFSTISKKEIERSRTPTKSYAATLSYADVEKGHLPPGFLAIDLAQNVLHAPLYDPDAPFLTRRDGNFYQTVIPCECDNASFRHPVTGNGIIGGKGKIPTGETTDAEVIVAANGGSDLIYLPQDNKAANTQTAQKIVSFLLRQDYTGGVFVRDDLGDIPGTLPLSAIGLMGATSMPKPAMIVAFKSFALKPGSLQSRVEIADTTLREGQGMHGSFSRADTFNAMLAFGPDFQSGYVDCAPTSNADIAVTVASLLKLEFPSGKGTLRGRILEEAFKGHPEAPASKAQVKPSSRAGENKLRTLLHYQTLGDFTYYDEACISEAQSCPDAAPVCVK